MDVINRIGMGFVLGLLKIPMIIVETLYNIDDNIVNKHLYNKAPFEKIGMFLGLLSFVSILVWV